MSTIIDIMTTHGHTTNLRVQTVSIHDGGMVLAVITDKADSTTIAVYDDEIDGLIEALTKLKGELR
jgi:hypothetical protein